MTNTLKSLIASIIGVYTPVTYQVEDAAGNLIDVIPSGFAGVDFCWVSSAVLVILSVYFLYKTFGGALYGFFHDRHA